MAASSRFATVSEDDFALKWFFFLFFNHLCIYTKAIICLKLKISLNIIVLYKLKWKTKFIIKLNILLKKKKKTSNKIKRSKTKYMLNKSWYCDIFNNDKDYKLAGKWTHLKSKKYKKSNQIKSL